jgi:hypothetical protein
MIAGLLTEYSSRNDRRRDGWKDGWMESMGMAGLIRPNRMKECIYYVRLANVREEQGNENEVGGVL